MGEHTKIKNKKNKKNKTEESARGSETHLKQQRVVVINISLIRLEEAYEEDEEEEEEAASMDQFFHPKLRGSLSPFLSVCLPVDMKPLGHSLR